MCDLLNMMSSASTNVAKKKKLLFYDGSSTNKIKETIPKNMSRYQSKEQRELDLMQRRW